MESTCNAQFSNVEFKAALRNCKQDVIHISGLKLGQKPCLDILAQKRYVFGIREETETCDRSNLLADV